MDQRIARAHRLGQTRGVSVIHLISERGIEKGIEGTLTSKRTMREALQPTSDTETVDLPSFSTFIHELEAVLASTDSEFNDLNNDNELPESTFSSDPNHIENTDSEHIFMLEQNTLETQNELAINTNEESGQNHSPIHSQDITNHPFSTSTRSIMDQAAYISVRLRLGHVVLDAGFASDTIQAAYDALATCIRCQLEFNAPQQHNELVAAIFRELIPQGKIPIAAHSLLARLHDLKSLDSFGISIDLDHARLLLSETESWIQKMNPIESVPLMQ